MELARSGLKLLLGLAAVVTAGWPVAAFGADASTPPVTVTVPPLTVPKLTVTVPSVPMPITLPGVTLPGLDHQPASPTSTTSVVHPATTTVTTAHGSTPATFGPASTLPATFEVGATRTTSQPRVSGRLAVQTARAFELPFAVAAAVVAFLIVQARIDRADPKLVDAPVGADEESIGFE